MIDNDKLRETVVVGVKDYLQIPFIKSNQNAEPPPYPFLSYTVTKLESENNGTWQEHDDGKNRKAVTQTWSISSLSDDENESITNASKAREWFDNVGRLYLKDNGVIVQSVGAITNRDNVLTTEYEYKNGFDVVFYMMNEVENPFTVSGEYIETAKIENIEAKNNRSTLSDLIGGEDVSDLVIQLKTANDVGRTNLAEKGVTVDSNATTYEIMEAIEQTEETGSYDKGFEEGQNSVQNPLEYAPMVAYSSISFPDGYELELDMPMVKNLDSLLTNTTGIKKLTLKGNTRGEALNFNGSFSCKSLEIIDATDFTLLPTTANYTFNQAVSLREVQGEWDLRKCTSATNVFYDCIALEEIRFKPLSIPYKCYIQYSPLLSLETIQSIVEGLMSVGGVLKVHSDVALKITDEQMLEITAKNWRVM